MAISQTTSPLKVEIISALPEDEPVLANLLELYVHDFSEFIELKLGADGRFGYPHLSSYWQAPDRYPFFIRVNEDLAGFVLVRKGSPITNEAEVWDMAEFFVLRGYRRRGVGVSAARQVWQKFPGKWEVRVIDRNQKAKAFWARAIAGLIGTTIDAVSFDKHGKNSHVFSFEAEAAAT